MENGTYEYGDGYIIQDHLQAFLHILKEAAFNDLN